MRGREADSPEAEIASAFIKSRFERAGLVPVGPNGSYYHPFVVTVHCRNPRSSHVSKLSTRLGVERSMAARFACAVRAALPGQSPSTISRSFSQLATRSSVVAPRKPTFSALTPDSCSAWMRSLTKPGGPIRELRSR